MNASVLPLGYTGWARTLSAIVHDVAAVRQPSEHVFFTLGNGLREAQGTARDLAIMAEALNQRLSDPEFRATLNGLDGVIDAVRHLCEHKDGRGQTLREMSLAASAMQDALAVLTRTLAAIRALGINARIEAVKMVGATGDFTVFTHQIMRLAADGEEQVEQAMGAVRSLHGAIAGAQKRQAALVANQMHQLGVVSEHLVGSVALMRARERDASAVLNALPKTLERVRGRIATLVGNLQIGDITRQRLEHVEQALETVRGILSSDTPPTDGDALSAEQIAVLGNAVCELQASQLQEISDDFSGHMTDIITDLEDLVATVHRMQSETEAVYAEGATGGSSFLLTVDRDLAEVAAMVAQVDAAQRETDAVMQDLRSASDALRTAMAAVAEIDAEINVIGLNASIKCGNLGDRGRALNVIAQELRAYARQTRAQAGQVAEGLTLIETHARSITVAGTEGDAEADLQHMRETLDHTVELLHQAGGETAWVLARIREKGKQVTAALRESERHLDAQRATTATMADLGLRAAALARKMAPDLPAADLRAARREVLSFMEAHYTMASERDLHALLLGERPTHAVAAVPPAATSAASDDDLSDVLF